MSEESKKMLKKYKPVLEQQLLARHGMGTLESEADFVAGAMAALVAVHGDEGANMIPPYWIIAITSGRGLVNEIRNH